MRLFIVCKGNTESIELEETADLSELHGAAAAAFNLVGMNIKLIHRGKTLPASGALAAANAAPGAKLMLVASARAGAVDERRAALRRNGEEYVALFLEWAQPVRSAFASLRVPAWREVLQWVAATGRGVILFVRRQPPSPASHLSASLLSALAARRRSLPRCCRSTSRACCCPPHCCERPDIGIKTEPKPCIRV